MTPTPTRPSLRLQDLANLTDDEVDALFPCRQKGLEMLWALLADCESERKSAQVEGREPEAATG